MLLVFLLKDGEDFYLCVDVAKFLLSRSTEEKNHSELSLSLDAFLLAQFMWNKKLSLQPDMAPHKPVM